MAGISPIADNSVLGSGNFEVISGGTFQGSRAEEEYRHRRKVIEGHHKGGGKVEYLPSPFLDPYGIRGNSIDDEEDDGFFRNFRDFADIHNSRQSRWRRPKPGLPHFFF